MSRAATKKQYRAAWEDHIRQIATLALAADLDDPEEYHEVKNSLAQWIDRATERQDLPDE